MNTLLKEFDHDEILAIQEAAHTAALYYVYQEIQDEASYATYLLEKEERTKLKKAHFASERLRAMIRQAEDPLFIRK